jgi:hypothetical protein
MGKGFLSARGLGSTLTQLVAIKKRFCQKDLQVEEYLFYSPAVSLLHKYVFYKPTWHTLFKYKHLFRSWRSISYSANTTVSDTTTLFLLAS